MRNLSLALVVLVAMAGCSKAAPSIDGKWRLFDAATGQPVDGKTGIPDITLDLFSDGNVVMTNEAAHIEKWGKWMFSPKAPLPGFTGVAEITLDGRTSTCSYQIEGTHLVFAGDGCGVAAPKGSVLTRVGEANGKFPAAAGVWILTKDGKPVEGASLTLNDDGSVVIKDPGHAVTGKWVADPRFVAHPGYSGSITFPFEGKEETCSYRVSRWELFFDSGCRIQVGGLHIVRP